MLVSKCCKENVHVLIDYYICNKCHRPCRTTFALQLTDDNEDERGSCTDLPKS